MRGRIGIDQRDAKMFLRAWRRKRFRAESCRGRFRMMHSYGADPFKDTSSVAMNPIIKFTTLFGLLATEIAVAMQKNGQTGLKLGIGVGLFVVALVFVYRSFYCMRIPEEGETPKPAMWKAPSRPELASVKR